MSLDLDHFYKACHTNNNEPQYSLDYSPVRGARIVGAMKETICRASWEKATCQLLTGYIGTGKTTELLHLKTELEQKLFHVIYFDAREDLDLADVDVGLLMLAIAHRISLSLGKLIPELKNNSQLRNHLRQVLATRNYNLVAAINEELLAPAIAFLKRQGKTGLVVIIDGLDRLDDPRSLRGSRQYETLFVDQAHQLRQLNCHTIYTFPPGLIFSTQYPALKQCFNSPPILLPLIPVQYRDGSQCEEGMGLLRQMILVRAFPTLEPAQRLSQLTEIFDSPETLDRLCRMSGGNVRALRGMMYRCLQEMEPPLSRNCIESIIQESSNGLADAVDSHEWRLLAQVAQQHQLADEAAEQILRRALFALDYEDSQGRWLDVNPLLLETKQLRALMGGKSA